MTFALSELKVRAFRRAAIALYSLWEEQKNNEKKLVAVHSRIFDTLILNEYIVLNKKEPTRKYPEHVVPCAYIRNLAFKMYWDACSIEEVADMIGRLLRIAYITSDQATLIDTKYKDTMPESWDPKTDSILKRLEEFGVGLIDPI